VTAATVASSSASASRTTDATTADRTNATGTNGAVDTIPTPQSAGTRSATITNGIARRSKNWNTTPMSTPSPAMTNVEGKISPRTLMFRRIPHNSLP